MPFGFMAARPKPPGPLARRAALSARRRRYRVAVNQSPVAQQRDRKDEDGSSGPRQCAVTAPPDRRARQDPRPGRQQPDLVRLPVAAPFWPRPGTCSRRRGASSRMRWRPPFPARLDPRARRRRDPKIRRKPDTEGIFVESDAISTAYAADYPGARRRNEDQRDAGRIECVDCEP